MPCHVADVKRQVLDNLEPPPKHCGSCARDSSQGILKHPSFLGGPGIHYWPQSQWIPRHGPVFSNYGPVPGGTARGRSLILACGQQSSYPFLNRQ